MLLKYSLRWVAPILQHECGQSAPRSGGDQIVKLSNFFLLFFFLGGRALLDTSPEADARLGRPLPDLGGMADQAAPGRRGRAAQFRARLGRRARYLIAVHCCARWRHARRRARSVCKQTLREPGMCRPARALISALSRTPRASLGTLSSRPKMLGWLKDACAS